MNYFVIPGLPQVSSPRTIIRCVCEYYGITIEKLLSENRHEQFVKARQMCFLLMREKIDNMRHATIGSIVGNRGHCTVVHGIKHITGLMQYDEKLSKDYETLKIRC